MIKVDDYNADKDLEALEKDIRKSRWFSQRFLIILLPAIISMMFGVSLMMIHEPMTMFFWPDLNGTLPDINDAIGGYLVPAGLVYATTFAFILQRVMEKQSNTADHLAKVHLSVHQLHQIIRYLNVPAGLEASLLLELKSIVYHVLLTALGTSKVCACGSSNKTGDSARLTRTDPLDETQNLWRLVDAVATKGDLHETLKEKMVELFYDLVNTHSELKGILARRIHLVEWAFQEALALFSYFGVLFINAYSKPMMVLMCLATVGSISLLCMAVGDLDCPFNGMFIIKVDPLCELSKSLHKAYLAKGGIGNGSAQPLPLKIEHR